MELELPRQGELPLRVKAEIVYVTAEGRVGVRVTSPLPGREPRAAVFRSRRSYSLALASMALIDKPERARQLARAIASDLSLYHEKKLIEGIEKDTLFDVMRDEIDEGRALYKSRVTPEIFSMGIYDRALVDMLLKSQGARSSPDLVAPARSGSWSRRTRPGSGWTCSWRQRSATVSRSQLARHIGEGAVTVNGAAGAPSRKLRAGDVVVWTPPPPVPTRDRGRGDAADGRARGSLAGRHRQAGRAGRAPGAGARGGDAGQRAAARTAATCAASAASCAPGIVHRIDKDTSGLLVVAKDDATMAALGAAFKAHTVERVYDALVAGKPPGPGGRIDTLYGRDPRDAQEVLEPRARRQARGHQLARGRAVRGRGAHRGAARDRAHAPGARAHGGARLPAAGRQDLRAAAARAGACGRSPTRWGGRRCTRGRSAFVHPATGERLAFASELPADMQAALAALRALG